MNFIFSKSLRAQFYLNNHDKASTAPPEPIEGNETIAGEPDNQSHANETANRKPKLCNHCTNATQPSESCPVPSPRTKHWRRRNGRNEVKTKQKYSGSAEWYTLLPGDPASEAGTDAGRSVGITTSAAVNESNSACYEDDKDDNMVVRDVSALAPVESDVDRGAYGFTTQHCSTHAGQARNDRHRPFSNEELMRADIVQGHTVLLRDIDRNIWLFTEKYRAKTLRQLQIKFDVSSLYHMKKENETCDVIVAFNNGGRLKSELSAALTREYQMVESITRISSTQVENVDDVIVQQALAEIRVMYSNIIIISSSSSSNDQEVLFIGLGDTPQQCRRNFNLLIWPDRDTESSDEQPNRKSSKQGASSGKAKQQESSYHDNGGWKAGKAWTKLKALAPIKGRKNGKNKQGHDQPAEGGHGQTTTGGHGQTTIGGYFQAIFRRS